MRVLLAALLSIVVVVPTGARPASAAINWTQVITAAISAVSSWASASNTQAAIQEATRQILTAVNSARTEILAQIQTIATAQTRACANHAVIEFFDIERMTPDNMQRFAQDATGCAVATESMISALTDQASVDQLGFAMNIVTPIALVARARTGLTTDGLKNTLRSANTQLVPKLAASHCTFWSPNFDPDIPLPRDGDIVSYDLYCTAYNNDHGYAYAEVVWPNRLPDNAFDPAVADATRNTSRAIAVAVLPMLGG
ncbi:hypothetical protein SAMN05444365_102187 [Micromonospora pattaloongensis]|uniref:Uncharacterized protein n=1 Tax=Micromonospora pattaloongensis TaxID=405436 RepID=A0A1H3JPU9_9ACTN|nr:hypothetical protein [Micromonospora pattaloongensis]SDY41294.1 hypothetical protein SAMN05444365_102187 [Micromonospora pattaloongensis]